MATFIHSVPSIRAFHVGALIVYFNSLAKMDSFEILKNLLASLVSIATLAFMLFRYLHKRDITNSRLIADTIRDATQRAFQVSHIESRVHELEEIQAENTKAIKELNDSLNHRLDQLFIVIANINKDSKNGI